MLYPLRKASHHANTIPDHTHTRKANYKNHRRTRRNRNPDHPHHYTTRNLPNRRGHSSGFLRRSWFERCRPAPKLRFRLPGIRPASSYPSEHSRFRQNKSTPTLRLHRCRSRPIRFSDKCRRHFDTIALHDPRSKPLQMPSPPTHCRTLRKEPQFLQAAFSFVFSSLFLSFGPAILFRRLDVFRLIAGNRLRNARRLAGPD